MENEQETAIRYKKAKWNNYSKDYMNKRRHPEIKERKKNLTNYIIEHKSIPKKEEPPKKPKYPAYFPKEDFNNRIDTLVLNNYSEIYEKELKDILIWDILDKKINLNPANIVNLFHSSDLEYAIEKTMKEREYICVEKDGKRMYKKEELKDVETQK